MLDTLIGSVERQAHEGGAGSPVVGVGHSFGGAILCCAAAHRPDLFERLVIVDPPMFRPAYRVLAYVASRMLHPRLWHPLVSGAQRRKNWWQDREAARSYLRTRGIFARMHPDSLDAFIEHALVELPEGTAERGEQEAGEPAREGGACRGVQLLFPPAAEAAIFATLPVELPFLPSGARLGQYDLDRAYGPARAGWFLYSSQVHPNIQLRQFALLELLYSNGFTQIALLLTGASECMPYSTQRMKSNKHYIANIANICMYVYV